MSTFSFQLSHSIKRSVVFAGALLTLAACATAQKTQTPSDADSTATTAQTTENVAANNDTADKDLTLDPASEATVETETVVDKPLTSPFIYRFLLAEIAGQRGDFQQSSHLFYQLAISEKDARFAERAAKVAAFGRVGSLVFPSVRLWAELAPDSREAQEAITEILVRSNKLAEAEPHLANLLKAKKTRAASFILITKLLNQSSDKTAALALIQNLAAPYPELAEAQIAIAQSAINARQPSLAITHLDKASALRPGWNFSAMLKGQLLFQQSVPEAIAFHESFLSQYPEVNDVRLNFARALVKYDQYARAKQEFPTIITAAHAALTRTDALDDAKRKIKQQAQRAAEKNLADTFAMIGLMAFQGKDYTAANSYLQQALDFNYDDPDQIYLYFGQIAEQLDKPEIARYWYQTIPNGKHYLAAQLNIANQIQASDSVDAAIEYLDNLDHLDIEQQTVLIQAQASMLHAAQRHQEAFLLLKQAVEARPSAIALVYDYALSAERVQEYTIMETQLQAVISARPNFAPAYNALGYSYADRNIKLEEALSLIQQALRIAPNDHYMMDSLGWVYYRLGRLDEAETQLQQAFDIQADPEIAAHLGEVLWQQGKHQAAKAIWQDSLAQYPDNKTLQSTIKKYNAS